MYRHEAHDYESIIREAMKLDSEESEKESTQSEFMNRYLKSKPGTWTLISVASESILRKGNSHTVFHFFWSITE